jgi:hypothetical protein
MFPFEGEFSSDVGQGRRIRACGCGGCDLCSHGCGVCCEASGGFHRDLERSGAVPLEFPLVRSVTVALFWPLRSC